jgi:hypothetical protein
MAVESLADALLIVNRSKIVYAQAHRLSKHALRR